MERVHKYAQMAAVFIGIFTPCILLAGYGYYLGYTTAFGLDPSLMPRSLSEVITESWYLGILAFVYLVPKWWWPVLAVFVLASFALGVLYWVRWAQSKGIDFVPKEISQINQGRVFFGLTQWHWFCLWKLVEELWSWVGWIFALILFAAAIGILPFSRGQKDAEQQLSLYREKGCATAENPSGQPCHSLLDIAEARTVLAEGVLITSNAERVALFIGNRLEVWTLMDNQILIKPLIKLSQK